MNIPEIAQAHPGWSHGPGGVRCMGCNEPIPTIDGRYDLGWNHHLLGVALPHIRKQILAEVIARPDTVDPDWKEKIATARQARAARIASGETP